MVNPKLEKTLKSIRKIPKEQLGRKDPLSADLAERSGDLANKTKITIRLDQSILDAAKKEAKERGLSYQKLINDKLLAAFELTKMSKVSHPTLSELNEKINRLTKRLQKLEKLLTKR